jgi:hypothetical protein
VNVSFPEEVEKALDARSSMGVIGDMGKFQQFQMGHAIRDAAKNPAGGLAGAGIGLGMGFGMVNQMAQGGFGMAPFGAPAGGSQPGQQMAPPPPPAAAAFHVTMNGQTQGPYAPEQLVAGGLTPETLVWCAGMPGWTPAGQVPALAALFRRAAPPPPPPPPAPAGS